MQWTQLITAILALIGALLGGYLSQIAGGAIAERREDRRLIREAQVALERWFSTRTGPMSLHYPGLPASQMQEISDSSVKEFFARHFSATVEAKSALGAVRKFDKRIGEVLDQERWDIPIESVATLREALLFAEKRVRLIG